MGVTNSLSPRLGLAIMWTDSMDIVINTGLSPHNDCGYQRFCSDIVYEGGCWEHDYIPPCHSDFTWPPPSHSQAEAGGNMVGYNSSGYCDNLELESQNIADFTMSQLSQLAPVYEGDILSSALYQTILGEDSSSSYSPDSASHNELEALQYPLEYKTESVDLSAGPSFYSPSYPDTQYQDIKPYSNMMFPFFTPGLSSLNAPKLYKVPTQVPKIMMKMWYCVSCAIHARIVAVRSVSDRRKRDTGKRKMMRPKPEAKKVEEKKDDVKA